MVHILEGHPLGGWTRIFFKDGYKTTSPNPFHQPVQWFCCWMDTLPILTLRSPNMHGRRTYCLPPHCTHVLQPCDIGLFKPMNFNWNKCVARYTCDNPGHSITKYNFASIFKDAWNEAIKPTTIINCFKGSGIRPLDRKSIKEDKIMPVMEVAQVSFNI